MSSAGKLDAAPLLGDHHKDSERGSDAASASSAARRAAADAKANHWRSTLFGFLNMTSVVGIVFANKVVMSVYGFRFSTMLTWVHLLVTAAGMQVMAKAGLFEAKQVPLRRVLPVSVGFVSSVVLNNLSLQLNPVSVYQILKIAITPCLVGIEVAFYNKRPTAKVVYCILVLCIGVAMATVQDFGSSSLDDTSAFGLFAGMGSAVMSALYQIWSGTKQKELGLNGTQLVHACTPPALAILTLAVPLFDDIGSPGDWRDDTVLGYPYTTSAVAAILLSAVMGLMVTTTTFIWIGLTSSLTYNVVGHIKTVAIVAGGFMLFGDDYTTQKLLGLAFAMTGIVGYSWLKMAEAGQLPGSKAAPALKA